MRKRLLIAGGFAGAFTFGLVVAIGPQETLEFLEGLVKIWKGVMT